MATDYPLVGPPTITLAQFQQVLTQAHSPAAGEAPAMYAAIRYYGVDPAVVLAIMQHESGFGKLGIAVGRNNGFGARFYSGTTNYGATDRGGWASFPNWTAGAAYTAHLLSTSDYAGSKSANTARTFATRYAPSSDGNNPAAYGLAVVNAINGWRGLPGVKASSSKGTKAARSATTKTTVNAAPAKSGVNPLVVVGIVGLLVILLALLLLR